MCMHLCDDYTRSLVKLVNRDNALLMVFINARSCHIAFVHTLYTISIKSNVNGNN